MRNAIGIGIGLVVLGLAACGGSSSSGPSTQFNATMNAASEVPPKTSSGTGTASYTVNGTTVNFTITYTGLSGPPSAGHIHVGTPTESGPVVVPFSGLPAATAGTITGSFTATNVNAGTSPSGVATTAGDLGSLLAAMRAGNTYTNLHTQANAAGEIRGQNQPQ